MDAPYAGFAPQPPSPIWLPGFGTAYPSLRSTDPWVNVRGPVLVVDDDADIREAVRDVLEQEGYEVAEARDGSDALTYLRSNPPPPLILLDWNMAPMNATQFMEMLAREPALSTIPVVLVTADARAAEKAGTGGYAGFLKKPVGLDALFGIVGRYCS